MNKYGLKWLLAVLISLTLVLLAFSVTVDVLRAIFPEKIPVQIRIVLDREK